MDYAQNIYMYLHNSCQ